MRWAACVGLLVVIVGTGSAQTPILTNVDERVVKVVQPPLLINNVSAGWPPPAWATQAHRDARPDYETLPVYFEVQNASTQAIWAYRIGIIAYDPFGDYLDTSRATAIINLAPQGKDYGRWSLRLRNPLLIWTIVVWLDGVKFADGNVWRVDPESVGLMVPGTAPVRFQTWHVLPEYRELMPQQPKDPN